MTEVEAGAIVAPEQIAAPTAPEESEGHLLVYRWFHAFIANSPASRSAESVNHISAIALPALIEAVDAALLAKKG